jgi:hypothetical protein
VRPVSGGRPRLERNHLTARQACRCASILLEGKTCHKRFADRARPCTSLTALRRTVGLENCLPLVLRGSCQCAVCALRCAKASMCAPPPELHREDNAPRTSSAVINVGRTRLVRKTAAAQATSPLREIRRPTPGTEVFSPVATVQSQTPPVAPTATHSPPRATRRDTALRAASRSEPTRS